MLSPRALPSSELASQSHRPWVRAWLLPVLVVSALLAATRWESLTSPPSQENIIGPWKEAEFLNRTNFDYHRLWYDEPDFSYGGSRTYVTSALPTIIALAMRVLPGGTLLFLVFHLMSIVSAAVTGVVLYRLIVDQVGVAVGVLTCLALFTNPLFSGQTYVTGMELPMTAFGMVAVWFACERRFYLAAVAAAAAFFMKASGIVFGLAIVTYLVLLLITNAHFRKDRSLLAALGVNVIFVGGQYALIRAAGSVSNLRTAENQHAATSLRSLPDWSPDFLLVLVIAFVGTSLWLVHRLWKTPDDVPLSGGSASRLDALSAIVSDKSFLTLAWIVLLGGLVANETVAVIPRYLVFLLPFLYATFVLLFAHTVAWQVVSSLALGVLICFNVVNTHARFYPGLVDVYGIDLARTGALIDRTHEVIDDHQANLAAMQALSEVNPGESIIAGRPYLDFIALPEMGYAQTPATVYGANSYPDEFTSIHDIDEVLDNPPANPIFIVVGNSWLHLDGLFDIPRPDPGDEVIYTDEQDSPLVVYKKNWPGGIAPGKRELQDWHLARMWPNARDVDRIKFRISFLRERGDFEQAASEAQQALQEYPRDYQLRQLTAALLMERGHLEESIDCCLGFLDRDRELRHKDYDAVVMHRYGPEVELVLPMLSTFVEPAVQASYEQALRLLHEGRLTAAATKLEEALQADPDHVASLFCLGMLRQGQSHLAEATTLFERILKIEPNHGPTAKHLAQIALAENNLEAALHMAQTGAQAAPKDARAYHTLGLVLAQMDKYESAAHAFEQAVALDPTNAEARRALESARHEQVIH